MYVGCKNVTRPAYLFLHDSKTHTILYGLITAGSCKTYMLAINQFEILIIIPDNQILVYIAIIFITH